ncbi:MAG: DUF2147 domain-containing protein [Saprospirales bacterium]|nr:DUF2147 domain-containing protein [Saprospirales bacterium]
MKVTAVLFMLLFGAISLNAQSIEGLWNTGKENTIINIKKVNSNYEGTIHDSDNSNAQIGKVLVKDIEKSGEDTYKGKLYVIDKGEWYNAEFKPKNEKLAITVSSGFEKRRLNGKKLVIYLKLHRK